MNYYKYWGKSKKTDDEEWDYHLLVYHCLDVAAVGDIWLKLNNAFVEKNAASYQLSEDSFREWFLFFLAIHDIGKFSVRFQNLCPELLEKLQSRTSTEPYFPRHDQLGWELYQNQLFEVLYNAHFSEEPRPKVESFFDIFAFCFLGHHGIPPSKQDIIGIKPFSAIDCKCAEEFFNTVRSMVISSRAIEEVREFLKRPRIERNSLENEIRCTTWTIAGLVTVCDWIGSGDSFPFCQNEMDLNQYYERTLVNARRAIEMAEIMPARASSKGGFSHLFPAYKNSPSALQKICDEMEVPCSPQLWILEDQTGSGKTEAALTLVSRILANGGGNGCFIALPTMATSNAMYERMAPVYSKLFTDEETPSLVLSHGSRHLSETFSKSFRDTFVNLSDNLDSNELSEEGSAHCAQWLADSSKKALLADCGVGTIDQVLLGGLPVRYQSLRVLGMSNKVLVVDEVHAYDAYMLRQLENILEYHAASGGSVILLSATLPLKVRQIFVNAFSKGLCCNENVLEQDSFPLVTCVTRDSCKEIPVQTRNESHREVGIKFCESKDNVYQLINESVSNGKCVCWIRNTISDVIESYSFLNSPETLNSDDLDIFHSRLALHDRLNTEKKILHHFGKDSNAQERKGRVVVASQVIEQSLDLDFDIMISDLAPIDLLIQRAGRLHRHFRDEEGNRIVKESKPGRSDPVFYIHIPPDPAGKPSGKWYENAFPQAAAVYNDTAVLWRSYQILKHEKMLKMPESARSLIEAVYGEEPKNDDDVFNKAEDNAWAEVMTKKSMADFNVLHFGSGYCTGSSNRWDEEERIPSRLSDPQNTVYLCRFIDGEVTPLYSDSEYPWDMSSLKLRKSKLAQIVYSVEIEQKVNKLQQQRRFKYDTLFVVFEGERLQAYGKDMKNRNVFITYEKNIGLSIENRDQKEVK